MKIVALMYLEEDNPAVTKLLEAHGVTAYSRFPLEGHGGGMKGWYGDVAPYESHMAFTVLPDEQAEQLVEAVKACEGCLDPGHPIHALMVDVERAVESGIPMKTSREISNTQESRS